MSWRPATVADVRSETPTARTVVLRVAGWPGHEAGQHVDIRMTAEDGYPATRSYSIASVPDGALVEVTVERLDDGEVSPYLVDQVAPGDQVELRGHVGGGSGMVPLMSIVRRGTDPSPLRGGQGSSQGLPWC